MTRWKSRRQPDDEPGPIRRFFRDLFGSGDATDHVEHYEEAVRRGNAVLTVTVADDDRVGEIKDVLEDCGAIDVDKRVEQWKASGYTPAAAGSALAVSGGAGETLKVIEEELKVGKRAVESGGVRIHRHTTERPVEEQVSLRDEHAVVERKQVDRPAGQADLQGFEAGEERRASM